MKIMIPLLGLVLIGTPQVAWAQDDTAINHAYEKADQGLADFNAGRYADALTHYTQAFSIVKLPALAVHMARTNVKLGHFIEAKRLYEQVPQLSDGVGEPHVQARARFEAEVELHQLTARIPKLLIKVSGIPNAAVTVQVDGVEMPLPKVDPGVLVDPGKHQVVAAAGHQRKDATATVAESETRTLSFEFVDETASAPKKPLSSESVDAATPSSMSPWRKAAWVSLGVGGTGILVWGVTGLVALNKSSKLDSLHCGQADQTPCPDDTRSSYEAWKTASTVSFYTGAGATLIGAALYFAAPKQHTSRDSVAHVVPWVGVSSAGIEGRF